MSRLRNEKVKNWRSKTGLTQVQVADVFGLSHATYKDAENKYLGDSKEESMLKVLRYYPDRIDCLVDCANNLTPQQISKAIQKNIDKGLSMNKIADLCGLHKKTLVRYSSDSSLLENCFFLNRLKIAACLIKPRQTRKSIQNKKIRDAYDESLFKALESLEKNIAEEPQLNELEELISLFEELKELDSKRATLISSINSNINALEIELKSVNLSALIEFPDEALKELVYLNYKIQNQ